MPDTDVSMPDICLTDHDTDAKVVTFAIFYDVQRQNIWLTYMGVI